jgi:hypothetical protein
VARYSEPRRDRRVHGGAAQEVPPEERIAVFDNDGTLWCEKPMPIELGFILQRLAAMAEQDASLRDRQPWKAAHKKDYGWLGQEDRAQPRRRNSRRLGPAHALSADRLDVLHRRVDAGHGRVARPAIIPDAHDEGQRPRTVVRSRCDHRRNPACARPGDPERSDA